MNVNHVAYKDATKNEVVLKQADRPTVHLQLAQSKQPKAKPKVMDTDFILI